MPTLLVLFHYLQWPNVLIELPETDHFAAHGARSIGEGPTVRAPTQRCTFRPTTFSSVQSVVQSVATDVLSQTSTVLYHTALIRRVQISTTLVQYSTTSFGQLSRSHSLTGGLPMFVPQRAVQFSWGHDWPLKCSLL